ncbi:MAG: helix-turn-helix domain-containing protein [Bacteroidota bacterium]
MYQEINSPPNTSSIIAAIWSFQTLEQNTWVKIVPDNCFDIIFELRSGKAYVAGMMTQSLQRMVPANSQLLGVRIPAGYWHNFSALAANELQHQRIQTNTVIPSLEVEEMVAALSQLNAIEDRAQYLQSKILNLQQTIDRGTDPLINSVVQVCYGHSGKIDIRVLANAHFISVRQLERRFKRRVGIRLIEFINIIRFHRAKAAVETCKDESLLSIAFRHGYYDHAHMTKAFKRIAGVPPSMYR